MYNIYIYKFYISTYDIYDIDNHIALVAENLLALRRHATIFWHCGGLQGRVPCSVAEARWFLWNLG